MHAFLYMCTYIYIYIAFFAQKLGQDDKITIKSCLEMIKFVMGATLLTFMDKYYEYGGNEEADDRGLMIGGYESAWLADLVAAYILENTGKHFAMAKYQEIYRDDGLLFLTGKWTKSDVTAWLKDFQLTINQLLSSDSLQFTAEI